MFPRRCFTMFIVFVIVSLVTGCNNASAPTPTALPPSATPVPTQPPTDTPTPVLPTATNTPLPTATATATPAPPTATPTLPPPTATASSTPKPTLPASPVPTKPPTAVPPTKPASMPGVDVVAERGKETCVNKYVSISYPWEGVQDPQGRKMFYWDEKWSVYPMYARPNIKLKTVISDCNKDNQCKGFTADFCVYVDGGAPPGGTYNTELTMIIASANPNGTGPRLLARFPVSFSWYIK